MTPETPDEYTEAIKAAITHCVRDELASLGGHLLATYGQKVVPVEDSGVSTPPTKGYILAGRAELAALGGYLLEQYGDGAKPVAYRKPEPPAVGEPPTTTPGSNA